MPIELFAWIVVIFSLIKLLVILKNPNKWLKVAEFVWKNPMVIRIVSPVLAIIVLFNILQQISIVQLFSVLLFLILMCAASMAAYSGDFLLFARKVLKRNDLIKKSWLPVLIWLLLSLWVLIELI